MKAIEQYVPYVVVITLYKVIITFYSVSEMVRCDHSNESCCRFPTWEATERSSVIQQFNLAVQKHGSINVYTVKDTDVRLRAGWKEN